MPVTVIAKKIAFLKKKLKAKMKNPKSKTRKKSKTKKSMKVLSPIKEGKSKVVKSKTKSKSKSKSKSKNTKTKKKPKPNIDNYYYETERGEMQEEQEREKEHARSKIIDAKIKTMKNPFAIEAIPSRFDGVTKQEIELFVDPCRVLNQLKKQIGQKKWDFKDIRKMDVNLPELKEKYSGRTSKVYERPVTIVNGTQLFYGNNVITIKEIIGEGSNGVIRKAKVTYNFMNPTETRSYKNIAVKFCNYDNEDGINEFIMESIIQNEIWCDQRMNPSKIDSKLVKLVPKIEFLGKVKTKEMDYFGKFVFKTQYVIGMEQLDGDLFGFLNKGGYHSDILKKKMDMAIKDKEPKTTAEVIERQTNGVINAMIDIAKKIKILQEKYKFIHRDFHTGNAMYRKDKNGKYSWFIIDFGMSTAIVDKKQNYFINQIRTEGDFYDDWWNTDMSKINKSQDMRIMLTSLIRYFLKLESTPENVLKVNWILKDLPLTTIKNKRLQKIKTQLLSYLSMVKYIVKIIQLTGHYTETKINESALFHNYYDQVFAYDDPNFYPENIISNLEKILKGGKPEIIPLTSYNIENDVAVELDLNT